MTENKLNFFFGIYRVAQKSKPNYTKIIKNFVKSY